MKDTIVVIGGGPAGTFTARALKQQGFNPIIIEKEPNLGGMCSTYKEASGAMTERGAVLVAPNYSLLTAMRELNVHAQKKLPVKPVSQLNAFQSMSVINKFFYGLKYLKELVSFACDVYRFKTLKQSREPLPELYRGSFKAYLDARNMTHSRMAYEGLLPGCGYGAFENIPTWLVFEYLGYSTIAFTSLPGQGLRVVEGGYQHIVEKMADDIPSYTGATITQIQRNLDSKHPINVTLKQGSTVSEIQADRMILACSPDTWPQLNMQLNDLEQSWVDKMQSLAYPVAICKIKGLPAEFRFNEEALQLEGFNKAALITTRDRREAPEDGRLCTVYFNINQDFDFSIFDSAHQDRLKAMIAQDFPHIESPDLIEIKEVKVWNYHRYLELEDRYLVEDQQGKNNTYYVGSYLTYEDVNLAVQSTHRVIDEIANAPKSWWNKSLEQVKNCMFFYQPPATRNQDAPASNHGLEQEDIPFGAAYL